MALHGRYLMVLISFLHYGSGWYDSVVLQHHEFLDARSDCCILCGVPETVPADRKTERESDPPAAVAIAVVGPLRCASPKGRPLVGVHSKRAVVGASG
jgi:hypothetical protein